VFRPAADYNIAPTVAASVSTARLGGRRCDLRHPAGRNVIGHAVELAGRAMNHNAH
jgi:hypothetical protein